MKLDNIKFEYLTKETLLKHLDQYDIYAYYLGTFDVYNIMSSPFRADKSPSFGVFQVDGKLIYNDFKLGGGDCIMFTMYMESCNYQQALGILNRRYKINLIEYKTQYANSKFTRPAKKYNKIVNEKEDYWINISLRHWMKRDKEYWSQYEISLATLEFYNVNPINRFWINTYTYNVDKLSYSYYYSDRVYKIYQPHKTVATGKFFSNIKDKEQYQGSNQLPDKGDILFITSSLKDVMVLYEAGFWAIAPHTEHQILSERLFMHYSSKWDLVNVLYDNDEAGILHANKMVEKFGIKSIVMPDSDTKDPSDFVKKYDLNSLKQWIQQQI